MNPLNNFATGDIDYVTKMNANNALLQAAITALEQFMGTTISSTSNPGALYQAMMGSEVAVVGATSYQCTGAGTTLTVKKGFCWKPSLSAVVQLAADTTISFSGQAAGTYYLQVDAIGNPTRSANITEAVYSISWLGTSFGTITRLAKVIWGAEDDIAAQNNTALGTTYTSFDALLEALGTKAVAGDSAQNWKKGRLVKSVAGGVGVTLTDTEANNFALEFTGAITADVAVTIPVPAAGPRGWVMYNNTTGNFNLTVKTSGGAALKLPRGSRIWVLHDGSSLFMIQTAPFRPAVKSVPSAAGMTADFSDADVVTLTLTQNSSVTLTGAADEQRCLLEVIQGGAGGYTLNFGAEVVFGTALTTITLSTVAGKKDRIGLIFNGTTSKYEVVAYIPGF